MTALGFVGLIVSFIIAGRDDNNHAGAAYLAAISILAISIGITIKLWEIMP